MYLNIKEITVYAFSIENFRRPAEETEMIFSFLTERLKFLASSPVGLQARIRIIGNRSLIKPEVLAELDKIQQESDKPHKKHIFNICVAYTSRDEIAHAIQTCAVEREAMTISKESITAAHLENKMYFGPDTNPLDVLVRTSGHTRLSDFLLWQCNLRCVINFLQTLWPDFKFLDLYWILLSWSYSRYHGQKRYAITPASHHAASIDLRRLPPCPPLASVSDATA